MLKTFEIIEGVGQSFLYQTIIGENLSTFPISFWGPRNPEKKGKEMEALLIAYLIEEWGIIEEDEEK